MMDSCYRQTYRNWELCLADGSDEAHKEVLEYCEKEAEKDSRIRYQKLEENGGISINTNACIKMATGDYIALFDHDDILHPSVLYECMKVICEEGADYIYTDEATFEGYDIRNIITYHFKPDFAIDNLRANNYICHFSTFKATLLEETGLFLLKTMILFYGSLLLQKKYIIFQNFCIIGALMRDLWHKISILKHMRLMLENVPSKTICPDRESRQR